MVPPHISCVLLDRDGTINVRRVGDYVRTPEELTLLPGAAAAIAELNRRGLPVFVMSNQRGVARGLMSEADLAAVHRRLAELLAAEGAHVDGVYVCPHEAGSCECRKPLTGLATQLLRDYPELDLTRAVMIGDSASDMQFGTAIGARTVFLGDAQDVPADAAAPDLAAAVTMLDRLAAPR